MSQNLFWPIYKKIENEFKELSFYISFDKKQLDVYSLKIADLILRTVSECENIAKEICIKNNIHFKNSKGQKREKVFFSEYIKELNNIYNIEKKIVKFEFENASSDIFDQNLVPFELESMNNKGKKKSTWCWYNSYNKIKHDRITNFYEANLINLIKALSALFLLNIYYWDKKFYLTTSYDVSTIADQIIKFSDVFEVEYTVIVDEKNKNVNYQNTFLNPYAFYKVAEKFSVYVINFNQELKTDNDIGKDLLDQLEASVLISNTNGSFKKKHESYNCTDHKTLCATIAYINKIKK